MTSHPRRRIHAKRDALDSSAHTRSHDWDFCPHDDKEWYWETSDGCSGRVFDWCVLIEPGCPIWLSDVVKRFHRDREGKLEDCASWSHPLAMIRGAVEALVERYRDRVELGRTLSSIFTTDLFVSSAGETLTPTTPN